MLKFKKLFKCSLKILSRIKRGQKKEMFWKCFFSNYPEGEKSAQPPLQHIEIIKEKVGVRRNLDLI